MKNKTIFFKAFLVFVILSITCSLLSKEQNRTIRLYHFLDDLTEVTLFNKIKIFNKLGLDFNNSTQHLFIVNNEYMESQKIYRDDYVIVDRSLDHRNNDIVVAEYDGKLVLRKLVKSGENYFIFSKYSKINNPKFKIWGVVTHSFNKNHLENSKLVGYK